MATEAQIKAAERALGGRKGFDDLLHELDADVRRELLAEVVDGVMSCMTREVEGDPMPQSEEDRALIGLVALSAIRLAKAHGLADQLGDFPVTGAALDALLWPFGAAVPGDHRMGGRS